MALLVLLRRFKNAWLKQSAAVIFLLLATLAASSAALALVGRQQDSLDGKVEDLLEALLRQRGALHIFDSLDLSGQLFALLSGDGREALLLQALELKEHALKRKPEEGEGEDCKPSQGPHANPTWCRRGYCQ